MIMLDNYRKLVNDIVNGYEIGEVNIKEIYARSKNILKDEFIEQVLTIFDYHIHNDKDIIKAVRNNSKINFISYIRYYEDTQKFVNDNWDRLKEIIDILNDKLNEEDKLRNE